MLVLGGPYVRLKAVAVFEHDKDSKREIQIQEASLMKIINSIIGLIELIDSR